jgi:hypothetical protein
VLIVGPGEVWAKPQLSLAFLAVLSVKFRSMQLSKEQA